ncbi:hypothetical protein [Vulcanisaeta thermophila]|uniref:hypothetical protein n=1 Tax=Vulcanisaeta thermophila TaxID=867917 RepID=UPI0008538947|nr:hypothetical protein [Vulcanisaeta thermophila]
MDELIIALISEDQKRPGIHGGDNDIRRSLSPRGSELIRNELNRLYTSLTSRTTGNPLTKEEIEEIGRLIKKDKLTLEEEKKKKETTPS